MKPLVKLLGFILILALASTASATMLWTFTGALTTNDPTQTGRMTRNGIPSDWSAQKAFPGVTNATTAYRYETFTLPAGMFAFAPYVQIIMDSVSTNTFASAYAGSYVPTSLSTNYLGDAGTSGNFFGVDPLFFQVVMPASTDLVLVINETTSGAGVGAPFTLTVEGYADSQYTDPVPEPASLLLLGSGLALVAKRLRK